MPVEVDTEFEVDTEVEVDINVETAEAPVPEAIELGSVPKEAVELATVA